MRYIVTYEATRTKELLPKIIKTTIVEGDLGKWFEEMRESCGEGQEENPITTFVILFAMQVSDKAELPSPIKGETTMTKETIKKGFFGKGR